MAETARFALDLAEESWRLETEALGFDPPLPDGGDGGSTDLDIYLASIEETSGGAYTQPTFIDIDSTDDIQSCTTYIAISESISWELLPVYIAHELNHASQAAMDFQEIIWAWEATATFIEDKVYDDINDYYWYLPYFQGYPEKSLTCYDNTCSLYPYGASIFLHFVNEALVLEPSQIGLLWDASKQPSWGNEPDFLDALQALSQQHGWNGLDELYVHFAEWRYFVGENDDGEHFEEGQEWGDVPGAEVPLSGVFEFEDLPLQGTLEHVSDYGTVYIGLNIGGQGSGKQVRVSVESSGGVHVGTLGIRKGSESIDVFHSDDSLQPTKSETIIPLENTEDLIIGIINLGPEGYDADDAPQDSILEFKVELEREGVGGCRCSTKHDASLGVTGYGDLTLLGLLILFVARRKRSYPAQVSYGVTSRSSTSL